MMPIPMAGKLLLQIEKSKVDDIVDRAHYMLTVVGLLFAMLLIGAKQIFGDPIRCMVPAEYPGAWGSYVNEYCFITTTFVAQNGESLLDSPEAFDLANRLDVSYYQWVPYLLLGQALFFFLPHFAWSHLLYSTDIDVRVVVSHCTEARAETDVKKSKANVKEIAIYIKNAIKAHRKLGIRQDGLGSSGTICYMASKLVALINLMVQFYFLNATVGRGNAFWGFNVVWNALNGMHWDRTGFFPRVSYCEWARENLGQSHVKITQCALMVNMLNEKVFTLIYFWFLGLFIVTLANLFYCAVLFAYLHFRVEIIYDYLSKLQLFAPGCPIDEGRVEMFVTDKLGHDGFLLLYFIDGHAGRLTAADVTCQLFKEIYAPDPEPKPKAISDEEDKKAHGGEDDAKPSSDTLTQDKDENEEPMQPIAEPAIDV